MACCSHLGSNFDCERDAAASRFHCLAEKCSNYSSELGNCAALVIGSLLPNNQ